MSTGGLTIFDGAELRSVDRTPPELGGCVIGARLLELAESKVSESLSGLSLPPHLKEAAISRVSAGDDVTFLRTELDPEQASEKLGEYVSVIADALRDDPIVASILDGSTLRLFLEDEDDFAMLAENLFTDLDVDDNGKLKKSEIRNALAHMGVEMGVPPFSEFPVLDDIIKKHGAEGDDELGQAQFAQLLQPILQEIADALHGKPIVVVQNIKIFNGSRLRKLLADERQLKDLAEKIIPEKPDEKDGRAETEIIQAFLEKSGTDLGLPPLSSDNEQVTLLYESVLPREKNEEKGVPTSREDGFLSTLNEILRKFAEQLETNPVDCRVSP
ncbi:PREDICTED: uncharacterized protein LOC104821676 [Tarenaya hassleriana]|uniref:uncharacterized protein LOC104821676 n=1 Tax=Tarenaya hassleriana TaxID=28532 RepID=UPI00053C7EEC|nr:PREDICTED: uncharacterized protein LOC104821676 [Tarenaya hassleriana]